MSANYFKNGSLHIYRENVREMKSKCRKMLILLKPRWEGIQVFSVLAFSFFLHF